MKLIPDSPTEPLQDAERFAQALHNTMEAGVAATVPLTSTPDPGQRIGPDRTGLPASVIPQESAQVERRREAAELERSKQAAHDAAVESARLRGRLEGLREGERRP